MVNHAEHAFMSARLTASSSNLPIDYRRQAAQTAAGCDSCQAMVVRDRPISKIPGASIRSRLGASMGHYQVSADALADKR